jgi:FtsH-binding integral membrane protein
MEIVKQYENQKKTDKIRTRKWLKNMYKASTIYIIVVIFAVIYKQPVEVTWYIAQLFGFAGMWAIYYIFFVIWLKISNKLLKMKERAEHFQKDKPNTIVKDTESKIRF